MLKQGIYTITIFITADSVALKVDISLLQKHHVFNLAFLSFAA